MNSMPFFTQEFETDFLAFDWHISILDMFKPNCLSIQELFEVLKLPSISTLQCQLKHFAKKKNKREQEFADFIPPPLFLFPPRTNSEIFWIKD